MSKLTTALILSIVGNIFAWVHMNAQFRWEWAKGPLFITMMGVPVSWCFYYATRYYVEHFGVQWSMRMMGFGIGTVSFGLLTWIFLNEIPTLKIYISLLLALAIILLQITNVVK